MKKLIMSFIYILFVVSVQAQQEYSDTEGLPVVKFKVVADQPDSVVVIYTTEFHNAEIFSGGKQAPLLHSVLDWNQELRSDLQPENDTLQKSPEAWYAWVCMKVIPDEVKAMFNLEVQQRFLTFSGPEYLKVPVEQQIILLFDENLEIIQVNFFFDNRDLASRISGKQLRAIFQAIVNNVRLPEGYFHIPTKEDIKGHDYIVDNIYQLRLYTNLHLRWAKDCQDKNPELWNTIVNRFELNVK